MWSAAKKNSCGNKFEWCSQKLFFQLNPDLVWKDQGSILPSENCVTFELDLEAQDGRLGLSYCQKPNRIVCEVSFCNFINNKLTLHFNSLAKELKIQA
jgi:hypothetical protein